MKPNNIVQLVNTYGRFTVDSGKVTYSSKPVLQTIGSNTRSGSTVPDYRQRIAKKISASSNYNRTWCNVKSPGSFFVFATKDSEPERTHSTIWGWYDGYTALANNTSLDAATRDIALAKIKAKIASDDADYSVLENLPQDIYQFEDTIHSGLDSTAKLVKAVTRLVQRKGSSAKNISYLLQSVADLWLNFSFGINPTIQDAKDFAASIQSFLNRHDRVKHFHAQHYNDQKASRVSPGLTMCSGINGYVTSEVYRKYSQKYISAHIFRTVSGNNYGAFADHFHLAPSDFIPMIWELLPWSWLIDYVSTCGAVISDTFTSSSDSSLYNCGNTRIEYNMINTIDFRATKGWTIHQKQYSPRVISTGQFSRTSFTTLPMRSFRFKTSSEIGDHDITKLLNLLAVLKGQSRKFLRTPDLHLSNGIRV